MSRRTNLVLILILLISSRPFRLNAQEEKYIGLFVYNFTKYFDWPESSKTGDFVIQILGHKSVYEELSRLTAGKKIGNQNIIIQNINTIQEVTRSQIVFIGYWQSRLISEVLTKIGNYPSLIVSEMEGLLDQGSAINFIIREGTIEFEIKMPNVDSHQIKTDPRIRELAYRVVE